MMPFVPAAGRKGAMESTCDCGCHSFRQVIHPNGERGHGKWGQPYILSKNVPACFQRYQTSAIASAVEGNWRRAAITSTSEIGTRSSPGGPA